MAFKKGQSGNPSGRPLSKLRAESVEAFEKVGGVKWLLSFNKSERGRLALLNYFKALLPRPKDSDDGVSDDKSTIIITEVDSPSLDYSALSRDELKVYSDLKLKIRHDTPSHSSVVKRGEAVKA